MHPILFQFGPFTVYTYGVALAVAFSVGTFLAKIEAQRQGIASEKILNLSLYLAASGILGARILYVLQNLSFYLDNPLEALMLYKGGLSFFGGFILAAITAVVFLKKEHLPVLKVMDIVSPYLALAQAIGRIGCFLNGCCYGKSGHPVQLYASLGLLLIFLILRIAQAIGRNKAQIQGQTFLGYCLLYSGFRFGLEYLRADTLRIFANLSIHQVISLIIFASAGVIWWKRRRDSSLR